MSRIVLSLALLTGVYLAALASIDPWDVALGALLSAVLLWRFGPAVFAGRAPGARIVLHRLTSMPPLAGAVLLDVLAGTWTVTLVVLHVRPLRRPGIVAIPIEDRTATGVAATALLKTLSPGSLLVDVDWERRVMLFHVLDAADPDAIRASYHAFYRQYQRDVFP